MPNLSLSEQASCTRGAGLLSSNLAPQGEWGMQASSSAWLASNLIQNQISKEMQALWHFVRQNEATAENFESRWSPFLPSPATLALFTLPICSNDAKRCQTCIVEACRIQILEAISSCRCLWLNCISCGMHVVSLITLDRSQRWRCSGCFHFLLFGCLRNQVCFKP